MRVQIPKTINKKSADPKPKTKHWNWHIHDATLVLHSVKLQSSNRRIDVAPGLASPRVDNFTVISQHTLLNRHPRETIKNTTTVLYQIIKKKKEHVRGGGRGGALEIRPCVHRKLIIGFLPPGCSPLLRPPPPEGLPFPEAALGVGGVTVDA